MKKCIQFAVFHNGHYKNIPDAFSMKSYLSKIKTSPQS